MKALCLVKTLDMRLSKLGTLVLGALILLTLPVAAQATAPTCTDLFARNENALILERLANVPELKRDMALMVEDPHIPNSIKRVLQVALVDQNVTVRALTKYLREALNLPDQAGAFARLVFKNFRLMETPGDHLTFNQQIHESIKNSPVLGNKAVIFVPQRPITAQTNDVLKLAHELAHVRFNAFLEKNIETLLARFPPHLLRRGPDGIIEMHPQLFDFISERYAHQIEVEVYLSTLGTYYDQSLTRYNTVTEQNYREFVVDFIIGNYRITDPDVLALKDHSLAQILRGHPFQNP